MSEHKFDCMVYCATEDDRMTIQCVFDETEVDNTVLLYYLMHIQRFVDEQIEQIMEVRTDLMPGELN